jgi:hypothetical protein
VADSLSDLRGPTSGTVVLDRRLYWSGRARYDVAQPAPAGQHVRDRAARGDQPDDLARRLNGPTLTRLWPDLVLPSQARQLWLDTLFLAHPVSFKGSVVQYVGRILRSYPGKTTVKVHDYVDASVGVLAAMWRKRSSSYSQLGFAVTEAIADRRS